MQYSTTLNYKHDTGKLSRAQATDALILHARRFPVANTSFEQVLLVIVLCWVKGRGRKHLCNNGQHIFFLLLRHRTEGCFLLSRRVEVDAGAILRAIIWALQRRDGGKIQMLEDGFTHEKKSNWAFE